MQLTDCRVDDPRRMAESMDEMIERCSGSTELSNNLNNTSIDNSIDGDVFDRMNVKQMVGRKKWCSCIQTG